MPKPSVMIIQVVLYYFGLFQGKYVEILFKHGGIPYGGRISNFLLEKVFLALK